MGVDSIIGGYATDGSEEMFRRGSATISVEEEAVFNFDLISISSSISDVKGSETTSSTPQSKNSNFSVLPGRVFGKEGRVHETSYETIADSVFSGRDNILDSYYDDTETESVPSVRSLQKQYNLPHYEVKVNNGQDVQVVKLEEPQGDDGSDGYSFIIDLIVDYDEVASIMSGRSLVFPSIETVLGQKASEKPKEVELVKEQREMEREVEREVKLVKEQREKPRGMEIVKEQRENSRNERVKEQRGFSKEKRVCSFHDFEKKAPKSILKQPTRSVGPENLFNTQTFKNEPENLFNTQTYKNDYTVPVSGGEGGEKKTLKYRVVVTRKNIIKNVKRLSKNLSRKSIYNAPNRGTSFENEGHKSVFANNKLVTAIRAVLTKVNAAEEGSVAQAKGQTVSTHNFDTKTKTIHVMPSTRSKNSLDRKPTGFSTSFTDKVKLKRSKTTNSVALTRLSGNYKRISGPGLLFRHLDEPPLPKHSSNIQIKKRSVLIKDETTDLYNLYTLDNPYLDPDTETKIEDLRRSKRISMAAAGISINKSSSAQHVGKSSKYINLASDSTLVKDEDSDTYTISYDIMPSPVKRNTKHDRNPYLAAIPESKESKPLRKAAKESKPPRKAATESKLKITAKTKPRTALPAYKASQMEYSKSLKSKPKSSPSQLQQLSSNPRLSALKPPPAVRAKPVASKRKPAVPIKHHSSSLKRNMAASKVRQRNYKSIQPKNIVFNERFGNTDQRKYFFA